MGFSHKHVVDVVFIEENTWAKGGAWTSSALLHSALVQIGHKGRNRGGCSSKGVFGCTEGKIAGAEEYRMTFPQHLNNLNTPLNLARENYRG